MTIGARPGGSHVFNATTDEILIFNRTVQPEEIKAMYQKQTEFFPTNAYYLKGIDVNPITTAVYSIGSSALRWLKGWFVDLDVKDKLIFNETEYLIFYNGTCLIANGTGQSGACL